ncbi:hypothetical protein VY88_12600 [Azospirillum thiophilum]|uniref:Uncharacterized protein n=1 Tax=Azospirillum thiophilum TaxID=528244 RepID=A0AAC9EWX5_9PROT|nr:hypothetical protein AL072_00110 [Azospirillum thiophilum]KJR66727.1 hypothetical protein VY88_12600 [Azospirillum thiophilum]
MPVIPAKAGIRMLSTMDHECAGLDPRRRGDDDQDVSTACLMRGGDAPMDPTISADREISPTCS